MTERKFIAEDYVNPVSVINECWQRPRNSYASAEVTLTFCLSLKLLIYPTDIGEVSAFTVKLSGD